MPEEDWEVEHSEEEHEPQDKVSFMLSLIIYYHNQRFMLAEPEVVSFNKTYRYSKKEESPFFTKYTLVPDNAIMHRS